MFEYIFTIASSIIMMEMTNSLHCLSDFHEVKQMLHSKKSWVRDSSPAAQPFRKTRSLRYLAWIPLALLTACATQQPMPPAASMPRAAVPLPVAPPAAGPALPTPPATAPEAAEPTASFDRTAALRTWVEQQNRLYQVAAPLLIHNTALCKRHARNLLGLTAKNQYSYGSDFVDIAQSVLGLDERLRVMNVLPGSGAEQAGVRDGDILLAVEIEPLPQGPDAERDGAAIVGSEMQGRSSLRLAVLRDDNPRALDVPLTPACAMAIDLGNTEQVNSYADGYRLMVTRGMLNFTQSDEELAYVIAKEIAHNVLAQQVREDMGTVIDRLHVLRADATSDDIDTGLPPYSPVMDATADKLALYMLVRAGYSIDNAPDFWRRLAAAYPEEERNSHTTLHPATRYRLSVMTEIAQVIKLKQEHNLPLVP